MLSDGVTFLSQLDFTGFVLVFWHFFLFDLPRSCFAVLAITIAAFREDRRPVACYNVPVDVLLVGYNEGGKLAWSVRALREQSHRNIRIIVINDGSTDDMHVAALSLFKRGEIHAYLKSDARGGKASALNLGLREGKSEFVVVADIDTSLDCDAVAKVIDPWMRDDEVGAVSGNLAVRNPRDSVLCSFQAIEYIRNISIGRRFTSAFGMLLIVSGGFGAFRRRALKCVGGWDVGPGDDSNITTKIRLAGWRVVFAPHAWAFTDVPSTRARLVRQRLRWNRSLVRNRIRKFRRVFHPWRANFSLGITLASALMIFSSFVLPFSFLIYVISTLTRFGHMGLFLLFGLHAAYLLVDCATLVLAFFTCSRLEMRPLAIYVVGYSFYRTYYMRFV